MKQCLKLILLLMFPVICGAQIGKEKHKDEIITIGFSKNDSLSIQIVYKEQIGCLGNYRGKIKISTIDDRIYFSHLSSNPEMNYEYFWASNKNILSIINEFETTAKKNKTMCGGVSFP